MRTLVCLGVVLALVTAVRADDKEAKHMRGKIVRVDAANNTITIKDDNNKEQELKVGATTQFFGTDKRPLNTGLKSTEFKEGTEVWYETSATDKTMISGLHLSQPGKDTDK